MAVVSETRPPFVKEFGTQFTNNEKALIKAVEDAIAMCVMPKFKAAVRVLKCRIA